MSAVHKLLALALIVALPRGAAADEPPYKIGAQPVWVLLGGVTTGGTVLSERGAYVGGELSIARLRNANHFGFYADSYYDWGVHGTYVTGGLEAGHRMFGIDAGPALRILDGEPQPGVTGRFTVGLGMLGLYVRYAYFDAMTTEHVLHVGLLVKLPFATFGGM